jgi:hypothetical protein
MVKDPTMQQVYRDSVDSYIYILIKTGLNVKEKIKTTKKNHAVQQQTTSPTRSISGSAQKSTCILF